MKHLVLGRHLTVTILAVLHLAILLAGFLAPYDPAMQTRTSPLSPPTRVHFVDGEGVFHFRPFVRSGDQNVYPVRFLVVGSPYLMLGMWRMKVHLFGLDQPGRLFLLGSDEFGRDQFSRILWGGQLSLVVGWLAAALAIGIGWGLGSLAGFVGGWTDWVIMRGTELVLALPWLYLLLTVRAFLPLSLPPYTTALILTVLVGIVGWARPARLIRGFMQVSRRSHPGGREDGARCLLAHTVSRAGCFMELPACRMRVRTGRRRQLRGRQPIRDQRHMVLSGGRLQLR